MMAVFPLIMIGTSEKQDGIELYFEKQTFPGGCKWTYVNWTLVGKGMMSHTRDRSHKDIALISISKERCVDFLAQSILCCFHSHFVTKEIFQFPTDHTKFTLTLPLIGFELKTQQIKPLLKRRGPPFHTPPCPFFLQASQHLDSF